MKRLLISMVAGGLALGLTSAAAGAAAAPSTSAGGTTRRVSVSSNGIEGDDHSSEPAVSAHGRYVAFVSLADNLVPNDTNDRPDVFVRDTRTGTLSRVSVASGGAQAGGKSSAPAVSAHGRFVAFVSKAHNLVPGDTNHASDVFVRDMRTGITSRVSLADGAAQAGGDSYRPALSARGRFVAFVSLADNLVPEDTNGRPDVFVRDLRTGTTRLVSVSSGGVQAASGSDPALSAHGRFVAFGSTAHNLVRGDTNHAGDIFVRDMRTGTTRRVSVSTSGAQADTGGSHRPAVSANGRYIAFDSSAHDLVPRDTNSAYDVFVRDTKTGLTRRVSLSGRGVEGNSESYRAAMSADGSQIAFCSLADNLVPRDTNMDGDVFLRDWSTGTTSLISVSSSGKQGNADSGDIGLAASSDGRYIAFDSAADDLVPGDTNVANDVFVRDTRG